MYGWMGKFIQNLMGMRKDKKLNEKRWKVKLESISKKNGKMYAKLNGNKYPK